MVKKAIYKGDGGQFLNGVPARDLQDDEYDALSTEQKHDVRYGGLYRMVDDKPAEKASADAPKASADAGRKDGG